MARGACQALWLPAVYGDDASSLEERDCEETKGGEALMVARHWRGLAKAESAAEYVHHLQTETFPSIRKLPGFVSASILRRTVPEGVEFLIVTHWASLDSIRAFAGHDLEVAVVPQRAHDMMVDYDRVVRHYDVVD